MSEKISICFELSKKDFDEEKKAAETDGIAIEKIEHIEPSSESDLEEARFVETLALVAVVTIPYIAKRLIDHWLKKKEQGIQIDLRKDPVNISNIANVPQGYVLIIEKDGTARTEQAKYDKPEDIVPLLQNILAK